MPKRFWLMKVEPDVFSIDDLAAAPGQTTCWDGVRNYQVRNWLRDDVRVGDGVLFYHSGGPTPAVAGTAIVARAGYPDPSQFDPRSDYHDPKSRSDEPRWYAVDVRFASRFAEPVTLDALRAVPALAEMAALKRGNRFSITPVTAAEWKIVTRLGKSR